MTTEREATVWMLMAMVVVVWACIGVGCSSQPKGQLGIRPTQSPATVEHTHSSAVHDAQPREAVFHGLALADPLRNWLDLADPQTAQPTLVWERPAPLRQDGWVPSPLETPAFFPGNLEVASLQAMPISTHGFEPLVTHSLQFTPRSTAANPLPLTLADVHPRQNAKFDAAGYIGLILGGLLLLFGGEAVVVRLLRQRWEAERLAREAAAAPADDDAGPTIFRIPDPAATPTAPPRTYRRAA